MTTFADADRAWANAAIAWDRYSEYCRGNWPAQTRMTALRTALAADAEARVLSAEARER